ncbi:hypothetical protein [Foetidibacter luteolus]|uniref:hypothetical protein n=1 Tax=Foetidibacter luteolus TaxID=2608880 RepID=UPI00129A4912|nr:hypothetical protein [Foetidibacter luteolus]
MLVNSTSLPASALKHATVQKMLDDAVLQRKQFGKTKAEIFIVNTEALHAYLQNHFGIENIHAYIEKYGDENLTRSDAVAIAGNSKLRSIRTFKGFLVNSYQPVKAMLNGKELFVNPLEGSYTFISNYASFIPDEAVNIVGIENPENFNYIRQQQHLFSHIKPLFVSRYPQSHDLIRWLQGISNPYLHFGDLDFEGIHIYLHEYKKYLAERAEFLVPASTEVLLQKHGNRALYNSQLSHAPSQLTMPEKPLAHLVQLLHQHKKVLEQEVFISRGKE